MTAALDAMDASGGDIERFTDGDIAFHGALLAATGNHLLTRLIEMVTPLLRFGRVMSLERRPDGPADSQRGHRAVLEAIRAGDADAARAAMREHLSWTADLRLPDDGGQRPTGGDGR
jgi:GntR family transcriptional repressor for pyruvate dehydrogenase complex